ncbi:MAG: ATP-dependent DNA helicase RecQ [Spirochaetae bacterium HGW-Spirochaetae-3]|jgi:ATP-dependent DNA helicase RecQ|nr:MAG: ATP-dependent DNA helicase RecQ [Spirochaetae bacterium HGW-Spirochaetae-3]
MDGLDPVGEYARDAFGIPYLYPYQRLVIANVLDAIEADADNGPVNQVVILPTGAGKSLCFQLPAALCPGPTLVVYPLLGLMADQAARLAAVGVTATVLKGGMTIPERESAFRDIGSGKARVIISNPETVGVPRVLELLKHASVFHFVVDEAHCVAEWGDGFRPAYLRLGDAIRSIAPRIVTAFTATASPPILARVSELLFTDRPYLLVSGAPDRPNIRYEVRPALSMRRALLTAVSGMPRPAIVFAPSRPGVQILAEDLRASIPGIDARFYHAGLEKAEKTTIETWFMSSRDGVLCSTCAYGLGMDKANIRTVIHFGPPSSVEAYLQESGRAGRDGNQAFAVMLRKATPGDFRAGSVTATPAQSSGVVASSADARKAIAQSRARIMEAYATGDYGCRRRFLLKGLGYDDADAVSCSSCDDCEGFAMRTAPGSREIASLARIHARRFTAREAASFLICEPGSPARRHRGALVGWNRDEVEEGIATAASIGLIRVRTRQPWKGRIASARITRTRARTPTQSGKTSSSSISSVDAAGASFAFFGSLKERLSRRRSSPRQGSAT